MSILGAINPFNVVGHVVELWEKHQDRKMQKEIAQAKVKEATIEGQTQVEMTQAQWEALAVAQTANSWKDEYVTVIITSPLLLLQMGGIWAAFTGDTRLLDGVVAGIVAIENTGVEMDLLMAAVVLAAIGLRFVRGR